MDIADLHLWELHLIKTIQTIRSPLVTSIFLLVNIFDHLLTYIFIATWLWNIKSKKIGFHLFYLISISTALCYFFKNVFAEPRPFDLLPTLGILTSNGYGLPSGAATQAFITFGYLFLLSSSTKLLLRGLCIFMILLVGFTRVYLGAHFPTDVLGGYLLSFCVLTIYKYSISHLEKWTKSISRSYLFLIQLPFLAVLFSISNLTSALIILLFGALTGYLFLNPPRISEDLLLPRWKKYTSGSIAIVGVLVLYTCLIFFIDWIASPFMKHCFQIAIAFIMGLWVSINQKFFLRCIK